MNIRQATIDYERWMRSHTRVIESDLKSKHQQMRSDVFLFFRGTFYRWAQQWPEVCADLNHAPKVIAVGDLHVNSFGTWRDAEGRMAWGVDDFDDAYPLPYTSDLVRLAASLKIVNDQGDLDTRLKIGCEILLESYEAALKAEGCPIVLAEHQTIMERLGIESIDPPEDFWGKLNRRPSAIGEIPGDAKRILKGTLPHEVHNYKFVLRKAGLGSLGQQRFVAIAEWEGGCIAREAKAIVPSSCAWLEGTRRRQQSLLSTCDRVGEARSRSLSENNWQMDNPATLARFESGRDSMLAEEARRRSTSSCHGHRSSKRTPRKQASRQGHPEGSPSKKIELVAGGE